ncbi:MAG: SRPBCC family protein [Hyphomonadaceae bacterium]|nr:SRPBCC family protein [Hyphomonadaceae bacterium]
MTSRTLSITRHFNAPRASVWRCWSEPELLKQWYCPKPWYVSEVTMDLRPGGAANTTMNGPDGEVMPNLGQYLEVVPGERLVFTDAFVGDWVPGANAPFMTGYVILSDAPDGGTHMEWGARHWSDEATEQHKSMGFEAGWNAAADQLDALASSL